MEKSLVVLGKDLEDALAKSESLLHCPREQIAYELLQDPKRGRNGFRGVSCKLRVTPVAPSIDELDPTSDYLVIEPETIPWSESQLVSMSSSEFTEALRQAMTLIPSQIVFPEVLPLPETFPAEDRELIGDVSASHGAIRHDGNLKIYGNVCKGARVQASGSVVVVGDVETAFIDAGSDVTIHGGLLGTVRSLWGNIDCKFAQGARMNAENAGIHVEDSCMHSHLRAGREITIGAIVLGGSCYGEVTVELAVAGSESGVPTMLIAGPNARLLEEVEKIRLQASNAVAEMQMQEKVCRALLPIEEAGKRLPAPQRIQLWRSLAAKTRLMDRLSQMSRQKSRRLGMINNDRQGRVCVLDRVYPRVKINVDEVTIEVQNVTQFVTFSKDYEVGEMRITPYK